MDTQADKKPITLDDLALMVANGFNDVTSRMATKEDLLNLATKEELAAMEARLKTEIEGLRNSVNNYLRLSDERYLELKHRQDVIVKWVAKLAEQNKIPIDLTELEYK